MQPHDSLPTNNDDYQNDDYQMTLQRLVDGELDMPDIEAILAAAENDSRQWRSIACAFVEDQLFAKQFANLAGECDVAVVKPIEQPLVKATLKPATVETHNAYSNSSLLRQLTFVASIAVAGLIGFLIAGDNGFGFGFSKPSNFSNVNSPDIASTELPQPDTGNLTPANLEPEFQLELLTPDGESIDGEVDLYRYGDLRQLVDVDESQPAGRKVFENVMPKSQLSDRDRLRMSRSGYAINESTDYVSGRLQDGRQFVVPVRSVRFDRGH